MLKTDIAYSPIQVKNALLKAIRESVPILRATIIRAVTRGVKTYTGTLIKKAHVESMSQPTESK